MEPQIAQITQRGLEAATKNKGIPRKVYYTT